MNFVAMDFLSDLGEVLTRFVTESGFAAFFTGDGWKNLIMIAVACVCLYLAIGKKYEPLLLVPISVGILLSNLPLAGMMNQTVLQELPENATVPDLHGRGRDDGFRTADRQSQEPDAGRGGTAGYLRGLPGCPGPRMGFPEPGL